MNQQAGSPFTQPKAVGRKPQLDSVDVDALCVRQREWGHKKMEEAQQMRSGYGRQAIKYQAQIRLHRHAIREPQAVHFAGQTYPDIYCHTARCM